MKRLISAALCLALALGLMAGCGSLEDVDLGVSAAPENTGAGDASSLQLDWDAARAKHELDATVLTVDGENADWGEFFYWLYYCYTNYVNDMGAVTDFSTPYIYNSEMTIGEMLIDAAKSYCVQYHALDVNARKEGVELTKEDEEALQALLESDIKEIAGEDGTEEELFAALEETYVSRELYELMNRTAALYSRAYNTLYGGTGEKLTEQEVKDFADEYSFMTAKHILIQTTDAEGEPIDEAAKAEKLAEAEEIYAQLEGKSGQELESAFDALMQEKSEDTGLAAFPDGTDTFKIYSAETCQRLKEMMRNNVLTQYGQAQFGDLPVCAKSGTAEVGGGQQPHAWFAGFIDDPEHPLAFVVLVENGGGGAAEAGSIAAKLLAQATGE